MKVAVIGASGGSGLAAVEQLLARGHEVTAFTRGAAPLPAHERLRQVRGDALNDRDLERAIEGQDAVIVTLGIRENALRVRLLGPARTRADVRSAGTRAVVDVMRRAGVRKLIVQTSYGVGATRGELGRLDRLFFALLLAPQIADTERQEQIVTASGLDWVLVQPVHLTDTGGGEPYASTDGATQLTKVSRASVGLYLARAVDRPELVGRSVALSGPKGGTRQLAAPQAP